MDGRTNNGGHSTKSKKKHDRRKRISISKRCELESFIDSFNSDIRLLYDSAYNKFLAEHINHGSYYVYTHSLENEIVYVGKGKNERAFTWVDRTNKEHSELLKNDHLHIKLLANNLTEEVALLIERCLIKDLSPKYNNR
jgi:hypothetical protein